MDTFITNAHWIIPLVILIISLGYNLYSLTDTVKRIEDRQNKVSEEYIKKVDQMDYRISRLEEFCCSEIE